MRVPNPLDLFKRCNSDQVFLELVSSRTAFDCDDETCKAIRARADVCFYRGAAFFAAAIGSVSTPVTMLMVRYCPIRILHVS